MVAQTHFQDFAKFTKWREVDAMTAIAALALGEMAPRKRHDDRPTVHFEPTSP
jgi:hypothetical protein